MTVDSLGVVQMVDTPLGFPMSRQGHHGPRDACLPAQGREHRVRSGAFADFLIPSRILHRKSSVWQAPVSVAPTIRLGRCTVT